MSESIFRPGIRSGSYPQKQESDLTEFEQNAACAFQKVRNLLNRGQIKQDSVVKQVEQHEQLLLNCSEEGLSLAIKEIKENLVRYGLKHSLIAQAFAVIREAAGRTLGKRHFEVQLFGGWLMINGMLAEMATGEGKTLTTTLPACTAAMAGIPVHVITANDYLAARDAEIMQPLYQRLGLVGVSVIEGMSMEQRRKNYQADIVHTTNKQITFDYLRDRIEIGKDTGHLKFQIRQIQREIGQGEEDQVLLRGLCFALIDEADSVLIDEAKTPLIITQKLSNEENPQTYSDALYLASTLMLNEDYTVDDKSRMIELTHQGEETLTRKIVVLGTQWHNKRKRELLVKQALTADYFYKKNVHYVVQDDKIQIVDEFSGRIMADRAWEQGLHQMLEAKEGCLISGQRETLARISYQSFFSRYLRMAGTSGTIKEVAAEMQSVYGLQTIAVPVCKPSKRVVLQERIYRTVELKKKALLERVAELNKKNRPILIGTCSVAESEEIGSMLRNAGYQNRVLNANQDKEEAEIIAKAGQQKAITVATNMAGRGTDIALGPGVHDLGGLHVIALNSNESKRIDRQLYGRCARQGDPGSTEAILSLQDSNLQHFYSSAMLKLINYLCPENQPIPDFFGRMILRYPQIVNEKRQRRIRKQVMLHDRQLSRLLAFSGKSE
jgi:preprotein translocase subunit SecA